MTASQPPSSSYALPGCCTCTAGLAASLGACLQILGGVLRSEPGARVAPLIRERVLSRRNSGSDIMDIHTLLVRPDPGRSLRRSYRTLGAIGKGGFGRVFRVQYLPTGEERAIKMIPKPRDPVETRRVLLEVELLISLDHPGIEKFFEFFEDAKVICLVTELCTGGNLGELDPAEDSDEDIRLLFRDIVSAVAYCHGKGVVHRDLKFENCLLTEPEGRGRRFAKVIDFGLSAVRPEGECGERWMDEAVGTVYFIAPEVLKSETGWCQKYGPKCDVWSIGVMLFIVLTDQHPFARSAASAGTIMSRIRRQPIRTAPLDEAGVDPIARDLLLRLLAKDPASRLSAQDALAHRFFRGASRSNIDVGRRKPSMSPQSMRSILSRVCSFAHFSRFERAILTLVAHDAQNREVEDLREAFLSLDTARAGWLSKQGIIATLSARGIRLPKEELQTAFEALDPDGDDKIQYTDWLAATIRPAALLSEKAMKEVFDFFDIHGEGKVSHADLVEVLGEDAVADGMPAGLQTEGNGDVTWEHFQTLIGQVAKNLQQQVDAAVRSSTKARVRDKRSWLAPKGAAVGGGAAAGEPPVAGRSQSAGLLQSADVSVS